MFHLHLTNNLRFKSVVKNHFYSDAFKVELLDITESNSLRIYLLT